MMILSDYLNGVIDNRGRNPDRYFEKEKYPVIDNFLIKNELHPNILQATRYINEQTYQNFLRGYVYPNMVIMTLVGNGIGNVTTISDVNSVIIQNTIGFDVKKDLLSDLFLFYFFRYKLDAIKQFDRGSGQPSIKKTDLLCMEVNFPALKIQEKIASILSSLDDKIELNQRQNNNLEQQAQALFKSVYDTNNKGVLADIVDVVESGSRPKGGAVSNGIPSIGAENIEKFGVYDYSKEKFIDKNFYDKMKRGKVISGDVLLYKDGAYTGKVSLALDGYPHNICAVNEHVFIIRSKQISSQFFLYFCLSDEKNKNYLHTLAASKAAQPGLNQGELLGLPIFIPNPTIVRDFTQSVSPMMHKIAANAIENNKLAAIRDALLPKLMSGEIDVSNVDISALTSTDKLSFTEE